MTDREALEKAIYYHQNSPEKQLGVIVDLDYTVIAEDGISAKLANTAGGSYLGRKIYPDISMASWRSEIVAKCLYDCYHHKKISKWLSLRFSRQSKYWLIILTYTPLINPDTDNVIGYKIIGELPAFPMIFYNLDKIIKQSHYDKNPELEHNNPDQLIEDAILFLLFHCDSYEQIAELLALAYRRKITRYMVSKIITRKIYPKFNVLNLPTLKKIAHDQGFHKKIPVLLLGEFMYELDNL